MDYRTALRERDTLATMWANPDVLADTIEYIAKHEKDRLKLEGYLLTNQSHILRDSDVYFWKSEMSTLASIGARKLTPYTLYREDVPTPSGFFFYEQPEVLNLYGNPWQIPIITWSPLLISDVQSPALHIIVYRKNESYIGPALTTFWEYGTLVKDLWEPDEGIYGVDDSKALAAIFRLLASSFLFLQQTLTSNERQDLNRADRRRYAKMGWPEPRLNVVYLRKREQAPHYASDGEPLDWNHRWWVSGHWRDQWYPSQNRHRKIWLDSYIKGPEGKPLVVNERVMAVVR